ncbi:MAG: pre-16S rRNA-processing nuclease YqgF [Leptolyngbyaceae bacterium]|nr:pre-16S rRNA-processing nuclease YqgF [Leptolyngbyaceae bacterium]
MSLSAPDPAASNRDLVFLGVDPGRDKCGLAVMDAQGTVYHHEVVASSGAIATIDTLIHTFNVQHLVLGDQTTSRQWHHRLEQELSSALPIHLVDERYSTLEARDRYWQLYPPQGLQQLIPQGLRSISRPIDDIVAIILIERYLKVLSKGESTPN